MRSVIVFLFLLLFAATSFGKEGTAALVSDFGESISTDGNNTQDGIGYLPPLHNNETTDMSPRGDTDPTHDDVDVELLEPSPEDYIDSNKDEEEDSSSPSASYSSHRVTLSTSAASWLDVFMIRYRDSIWKLFNTIFIVLWVIFCLFGLYRLLDLNMCSPHLSRTQYLVIHLLSFTAGIFEIVQLFHLNYGSPQRLPLFLTLLLTHTPTPLLACCIITMSYCVLVACKVPILDRYVPALLYVALLCSLLILMSFVGDIIVGVTYSSMFLLVIRLLINVFCITSFFSFIWNYKKIIKVGLSLRRDCFGELKSLAAPPNTMDESQEKKLHLKEILVPWARLTLFSCVCGVIMCCCCFLLSIFFTVSRVPLWAFWTLHSTIFTMQMIIVVTLYLGATLTLTCTSTSNVIKRFFIPCIFVKSKPPPPVVLPPPPPIAGTNFIYQRAGPLLSNGTVPRMAPTTEDIIEEDDTTDEINMMTPTYKPRVNLRRSATFNCAPPPHHHYYGMPPQTSTPVYPRLSEHLLPTHSSNSAQMLPQVSRVEATDLSENLYYRPSPNQVYPVDCDSPYRYVSRFPSKSYYARNHFSSLRRTHSARRQLRPDISGPVIHPPPVASQSGMGGTVEALEITYQNPHNHILMNPHYSSTSTFNPSPISFNRPSSAFSPNRSINGIPPEKPMRKVEPILVRGVLKENTGVLESASLNLSGGGTGSHLKRDLALGNPEASSNMTPRKNFLYGKNISPENGTEKTLDKMCLDELPEPSVNGNTKEFYSFNRASNSNLSIGYAAPSSPTRSQKSAIAMGSRSPVLKPRSPPPMVPKSRTTVPHNISHESASLATPESLSLKSVITDDDIDNCSEKTLKDEEETSSATLPNEKRRTLKRNNSTAGDFAPRSESGSECSNGDPNKYPWYGTWGGRKNKKRNGTSAPGLGKRTVSKSSLSSLYGKLRKPRNTKSAYYHTGDELSLDESEVEEDEKKEPEEVEEEEEFLPRLTEEIDLESEILKSSTMLANFYSLNRAELKNRKKEREHKNVEADNDEETMKFLNDENNFSSEINVEINST